MLNQFMIGCGALLCMGAAPGAVDAQHPGAYLNQQIFDVHAGSAFVWEALETAEQQVGEVRVENTPHSDKITVERNNLGGVQDPNGPVRNQYIIRVSPALPAGSEFTVRTLGTPSVQGNTDWVFSFILHVIQAKRPSPS